MAERRPPVMLARGIRRDVLLRRGGPAPLVGREVPIRDVLGREAPMRQEVRAFPLLPLLSAVLLLLALIQVGFWLWEPRERNVLQPLWDWVDTWRVPTSGEMPAIARAKRPAASVGDGAEVTALSGNIRRVLLATEPENIANAAVVLTVLSDPACGDCRAAVQRWQEAAAAGTTPVRVVYKFWPRDRAQTTGGLALELARKNGKVSEFWRLLNAAEGDLGDAEILVLLERAGVPLAAQREALSALAQQADLPGALERDMAQIGALELGPPPVALLNGYVLNERWLETATLARAIARLARGQALGDGVWLMER